LNTNQVKPHTIHLVNGDEHNIDEQLVEIEPVCWLARSPSQKDLSLDVHCTHVCQSVEEPKIRQQWPYDLISRLHMKLSLVLLPLSVLQTNLGLMPRKDANAR
jgi:hypothetical protein